METNLGKLKQETKAGASQQMHPSHQSVCMYTPNENITAANEYARNNRRIVGRAVFYAFRIISKESRQLVLPRASSFILFLITS
jgi:hypothetical protein